MQHERGGLSRRAAITASITALVLVTGKLSVGLLAGSMAMIASATDSGLDFLISIFNYFAIINAEKPSDKVFNYGRGKVKALASLFEGLIISVSAVFIMVSALIRLINGAQMTHTGPALWVMMFSTVVTGFLVLYMRSVAKKTGDMVIKADLLHYRMDLWTNLGILAAILIISRTQWHFIDPIISIGIGVYIFRETYGLIQEGVMMLLDRALEAELLDQIVAILKQSSITDYHMLRTRASAEVHFVDVHLVFHPKISLLDAHKIVEKIEKEISLLKSVPWVFNVHMDPVDDSKHDFGV